MPHDHAAGVGGAALLLGIGRGRQLDDLGLDRLGIDVVELAVIFPETRRLGLQRIDDHQPLELGQPRGDLVLVGCRHQGVEALAEQAVHLARRHHVDHLQDVVARVELGQVIERPVVVLGRRLAEQALLLADEELLVVLPEAGLARTQRLEAARLHVVGVGRFLVGR